MHRLLGAMCVLGGVSVASGQMWCSGAGGVRGGFAAPQTTFIPFNRGHNFLGTPSRVPRPIGRAPLHLQGAIDITPRSSGGYPSHYGGHHGGHHGGYHAGGVTSSTVHVGTGRQFFDGSGLTIKGHVSSGQVKLALQSGLTGSYDQPIAPSKPVAPSQPIAPGMPSMPGYEHLPPEVCPPPKPEHPIYRPVWPVHGGVVPWWWGWSSYRYPIDGPVVVYSTDLREPAPAEAAPEEEPLTEHQRAALLLRDGDVRGAIALLRAHIDADAQDAEAMRLLAIALLLDRQMCEAAALMSFAYEYDRTLVQRPLGGGNLPRGDRQLRDAVRKAVTYANAQETPSSWLLVTVLMQAEGRNFTAAAMLRKAVRAGLNEPVARAFEAALKL